MLATSGVGNGIANTLIGNGVANSLRGGGSVTPSNGGNGRDTIIGGAGNDVLAGGGGADRFVFDAKLLSTNLDVISDFKHNADTIALDDRFFGKVGSSLSTTEFYAGAGATKAHDRSDRIVYDTNTGKLYYDDDGNKSGGHAPIHFATLTTKPTLDHGDFAIV